MRPALLLFLAVLATSVVHAQAVAPLPPPVVAPPVTFVSPPGGVPGATPAGAGARTGEVGQPYQQPQAPRSPNKRVLPDEYATTREAGVWAADGAPTASDAKPTLFSVDLPYPPFARDATAKSPTLTCAKSMGEAASDAGVLDVILAFPPEVRRCLAARAYFRCADDMLRSMDKRRSMPDRRGVVRDTKSYAATMVDAACRGVAISEAQRAALASVLDHWSAGFPAIEETFK